MPYFHNSSSWRIMPLLSINSMLPSRDRGQFQKSVSLTSYVSVDSKSDCDRSDSNLDTEHLNTAIYSQKKFFKKSISLATNHDLNNNIQNQPDIQKPKRHKRSKSLNEFRKVSSNELLLSYFDNVKDSLIIDVSC